MATLVVMTEIIWTTETICCLGLTEKLHPPLSYIMKRLQSEPGAQALKKCQFPLPQVSGSEFWADILKSPHMGHSCLCSFMVGVEAAILAKYLFWQVKEWQGSSEKQSNVLLILQRVFPGMQAERKPQPRWENPRFGSVIFVPGAVGWTAEVMPQAQDRSVSW